MPIAAAVFKKRSEDAKRTVADDLGLQLTATLNTTYDSNIYRTDSNRTKSVDDVIVTSSIQAGYHEFFGRNELRVLGLVGYDRYISQSGRSKPRVSVSASGSAPTIGVCHVDPLASYRLERADYGDLNRVTEDLQHFARAAAELSCQRDAGFFPEVGYAINETKNESAFSYANQRGQTVSGALGYSLPSLGTVRLNVNYADVDRPQLDYHNRILRAGLILDRSVSSRTSIHADVHLLRLRTTSNGLPNFTGVGWEIFATSRLLLPLTLQFGTKRSILNDSLTTSGYAIENLFQSSATLPVSERTVAGLTADYHRRHFRQLAGLSATPVEADRVLDFGGTLTRSLTDRFRLTLAADRSQRWTMPRFANFHDARATIGASAIF